MNQPSLVEARVSKTENLSTLLCWIHHLVKRFCERGYEKEYKSGFPQGAQHVVLQLIATRFGKAPTAVRRKIMAIKDTEKLDRIAVTLLTARSLAEM